MCTLTTCTNLYNESIYVHAIHLHYTVTCEKYSIESMFTFQLIRQRLPPTPPPTHKNKNTLFWSTNSIDIIILLAVVVIVLQIFHKILFKLSSILKLTDLPNEIDFVVHLIVFNIAS